MKSFWRGVFSVSIVLGAVGATPLQAQGVPGTVQDASGELLARVLTAVAGQPVAAARFIERRLSALYATPLESRGTLTFKPPGVLEKQTTSPILELVVMSADIITIEGNQGTPRKVIKIDPQGDLAGYALGIRAILSGNAPLLRQVFDTKMTGGFDRWKLRLLPREATMRRAIRQIVVSGAGANLRLIETTEINGDVLEMTILPR